ncbi:hypothetical protein Tco_0625271 [Tanacetum coccineum]|uniref:Uncharacterized protein n=1 Tax=Tanacetum coccineum TaxID=301880 RepID=A0ABQ4WGC3_9ASTR
MKRFMSRQKFNELARHLQDIMIESLPKMVDERIKKILQTQVPLHVAQGIILEKEKSQAEVAKMIVDAIQQERENFLSEISSPFAVCPRDQDDPYDDAHPEGENSAKRQKTTEYGTFELGGSSFGQDYESKPDDNVIPNKKVSQELVDEISQTVDEAKSHKVVDEMLRQQCTSGDEHQYHIDQMQNFLKSDIVWESRKEILVPPYQPKPTPVVQSCQRGPKAPALSLVNQDLFVKHWKNSHAKIFYIRKQQEPGKPNEEIYSNSKNVQIIKTYWKLGHEHKFIIEIVARRANRCIVSITELNYKNLNKNDIKDMYLLIVNHKVDDYVETGLWWSLSVFIRSIVIWERVHDYQLGVESYQQQVNLTAPTITFPDIEKYKVFTIISEPVYGIIYKNNKKEKRVMRHQKVHKFCDATLKRVLEGLKSYNNDVKYGYVTHNLSKENVEYLQLFAEEIEERLKYRDQMRR